MPFIIPTYKRLALASALFILLMSCEKEMSEETGHASITAIDDYHEKYRKEVQAFSFNTTTGNPITTSKGAKLYLPVNGFVTEDGRPVTGKVSISLKEIYTPGEMILSDMPTIAGGKLLESAGEFQIRAYQNNNPLKLSPGNFIQIDLPASGRDMFGMQVFNGVADANGDVNWVLNTNPGNIVVRDSLLFSDASLFADDINWLNCDKFINDPTVEYTVYPGNAPGGDSTNVFVHLTGRNSVVKMNWTRGLNYFNSNMLLAVPSTIVGISAKDGRLYASISSATVSNGSSITMNFIPYSEEELKSRLEQLR